MSRGAKKLSLLPVQGAIFERLSNDAVLTSMVTGVYDELKEGYKLPYVQIGDDTNVPYDTKTNYADDASLTLHAWSAGPGKVEAKRIMEAMAQALTSAPLVLPIDFTFEGLELEFSECFNDGQAYHGVCRFRIYVKQN